MSNPFGIKFDSQAFNREDEQTINKVTAYLQERVMPKAADLKDDQQFDLNDSEFIDKTPALSEYVRAFDEFFPQVRGLYFYNERGHNNDVEWGWLETMTQLIPAMRWGIKYDRIDMTDPIMIEFAQLVFKKGKQVATGELDVRAEKDEAGQA